MNIEKHLIFVKNEDKTEQIQFCERVNGKWRVVYCNNSTEYSYNYNNIEWYSNPGIIIDNGYIIFDKEQPLSGIEKIFDFGSHIRIIFKSGYKKVYSKSSIIFEKNSLENNEAANCFSYFKKTIKSY